MAALDSANPFAAESALPFQLPDFASLSPDHYREAFDAGMARHDLEAPYCICPPLLASDRAERL